VDEERRLFYVALTRARKHLHIYAPLRYHHGDPAGWTDRHSYAQRTRFLPPELDELMDHRAIRSAIDVDLPVAAVPVSAAVDTELGGLW
jgi:DNA helicase-2/ATP-dependent DNA helicase PcrA